jgi:predicted Zn-dependent peptidase
MVSTDVPIEKVEQALDKVLRRLQSEGPTPSELSRARKGIVVDLASSLQLLNSGGGEGGRAGVLQQLNHYLGDPGRLPAEMQHLAAVQPAEVQAAAQKHLALDHRLTVVTMPKGPESTPSGGTP